MRSSSPRRFLDRADPPGSGTESYPWLPASHVFELFFTAHPASVYPSYDYNAEQIKYYMEATTTPASFRGYLYRFVYGIKDHW